MPTLVRSETGCALGLGEVLGVKKSGMKSGNLFEFHEPKRDPRTKTGSKKRPKNQTGPKIPTGGGTDRHFSSCFQCVL